MKRMFVCAAAMGIVGGMVLSASADVVTNSWIGADGAAWGTAANWSAGHVPDGTEYVIFPDKGSSYSINVDGDYSVGCFYVDYRNDSGTVDFTLTGSGRITGTGIAVHYLRTNRRLVLESGVTLDLSSQASNKHFMIYNGVVVKAGATNLVDAIHLHWNGAYVHLAGGFMNAQSYMSYRLSHTIRVDDGSFLSSARLMIASDAENSSLTFIQNGGYATVKDVDLSDLSSFTMNGGTFQFRAVPSIAEGATLNFNGGTNQFMVAITDGALAQRFLCGNERTAVAVLSGNNVLIDRNCTITAPLDVRGGSLCLTNVTKISGTKPLLLKRFVNSSAGDVKPTLQFPTLVLNGDPAFRSGNVREFYIEGPTTLRTLANINGRESRAVYPYITGDLTIDTRDWNDPSVTRNITIDIGPLNDATLTVTGGGTVTLVQHYANLHTPFRRVTVGDDTTLTLLVNNNEGGTEGTLHTEELVLGAQATLNATLVLKSLAYVSKLSIDPTARINVTVPDSFSGGKAFLIDTGSNAIPDLSGKINLVGDTEGCAIVRAGGNYIVVKKTVTAPDDTYQFEWTGGGGAGVNGWGTAANWYCNTIPEERLTHAFGAADAVTTAKAESKLSRPTVPDYKGSTIGQIIFRDTAVASFTITGSQFTYNCRASDGGTSSDIYSLSAFPQYINQQSIRSTDSFSFSARGDGPIIISSTFVGNQNKTMYICGDIRLDGESNKSWPNLVLVTKASSLPQTCLSVMCGTMTFANQTSALTIPNAGFRVAKGATLSFPKGSSSARYQWAKLPQLIVVDGTLDIQAPFFGGKDQVYGGEGTLRVSQPWPSVASSRISLVDTLTLDSAAVWTTVRSDSVATPLLLGASSGRPVIHAANGWTYGPAEGVEVSPSADRAAYIRTGATLAVEPGGGIATFVDPVAGPGTLEITNGTLKVTGGIASETSLAVAANGTFAWDTDTEVAGLTVATGGTLSFAGNVLTVDDDVSLAGVTLNDANNTLAGGSGWHRVLVAKSVLGEPVMPPSWETRLVPLAGDMVALELHDVRGTMLIFR